MHEVEDCLIVVGEVSDSFCNDKPIEGDMICLGGIWRHFYVYQVKERMAGFYWECSVVNVFPMTITEAT